MGNELAMAATLDLNLLRAFVSVVDTGSFAAAGARLGCTQSAITQQMQRLEVLTAVPLFVREGRQKQLSESGRQLLRYARELLMLNDQALRVLGSQEARESLRIGAPHDVADTLLPRLLRDIAQAYPNLRLDIHVGRSPHLMEALRQGQLDLTVSTRQDEAMQGCVLGISPTVWICATQFRLSPGQPVPLILIDEPSIFRRVALDALDRHHQPWRQAYSSSNLIGVKAAVQAGLGVTARGIEAWGPDVRILGEQEGLPRLPDITYYLWSRQGAESGVAASAYELLCSRHGLGDCSAVVQGA